MATILIVHGAFGGAWEWRGVAQLLERLGHAVVCQSLTGFGERVHLLTPETSLSTHIRDVTNLITYEELHDVTLVCQSYGGMVVTAVADLVPERLSQLVYFNALVPQDGQSVVDLLPAEMRERFERTAREAGDGWRVPAPPLENDPRVAAFARGRHVASPLRMFTDPVRLSGAATSLPRTFIWCTEEMQGLTGVPDVMRPFAERAQRDPDWRFRRINAMADAFITVPQDVAELINEAIDNFGQRQ